MEKTIGSIHIEYIIGRILRRRWFIILPFCISMIMGIYLAVTLPRIYEAKTLILVEAQKVPNDFVQPIVSDDIDERINTISQQILSRTNLEKIIKQLNLYSGPEYKDVYMEDKVVNMRKRIVVDVTRGRGRRDTTDSFSISFRGKVPEEVVEVVNNLATYYIDENLKVRESQALGTSSFLEEELNSMRQKLEQLEEEIKQYRKRYMGALPEQLETNLRILDRLQENITEREQRLSDVKNRLLLLETQLSQSSRMHQPDGQAHSNTGIMTIDQLQEQLNQLQTKYTDEHPDIIHLKKTITDLQKNIQSKTGQADEEITAIAGSSADAYGYARQRNDIKREIKSLEEEVSGLIAQKRRYEKCVEDTPKREQELMSLKRDYQNIQESYSSLLNRKLEAEIAVNMEKKQKGERFRILDSAKIPRKPIEPDMIKLFLFVIAAGLGCGGGIVFLFEYLDTSFKKPDELESYLGLSVLATVPPLYSTKDKRLQKINTIFSIMFIVIACILFAGFTVLIFKGVDQTLEILTRLVNIR